MKRFAAVLAAILALAPAVAHSQAQQPLSIAFALTAAGQNSPTMLFQAGTSSCSVVVSSGSGFTLVPQASSDAQINPSTPTWVTASAINSGSITTVGTYTGTIATTALSAFNVHLTTLGSGGSVTGVITCSAAVAAATPGPSPTPFNGVASVAGSNNIACSPTTGSVTCSEVNTPGPQATPSPTVAATPTAGAAAIPFSSTWPYTQTIDWYQQPITYVTTSNSSATTGTTGNTYQTISNVSGTTPAYSPGVNGNWLLTVHSDVFVSALVANGVYACVTLTGSPTTIDTTRGNGASNCVTTDTNSIMGTTLFGVLSSTLMVSMTAHVTLPVSTAYNLTLQVAGPGTVSYTVFGYAGALFTAH